MWIVFKAMSLEENTKILSIDGDKKVYSGVQLL